MVQSALPFLPDLTIALPCVLVSVVALSRRPFRRKSWIGLNDLVVAEARGGELIRLRLICSDIERTMSQHAIEKISLARFQ